MCTKTKQIFRTVPPKLGQLRGMVLVNGYTVNHQNSGSLRYVWKSQKSQSQATVLGKQMECRHHWPSTLVFGKNSKKRYDNNISAMEYILIAVLNLHKQLVYMPFLLGLNPLVRYVRTCSCTLYRQFLTHT